MPGIAKHSLPENCARLEDAPAMHHCQQREQDYEDKVPGELGGINFLFSTTYILVPSNTKGHRVKTAIPLLLIGSRLRRKPSCPLNTSIWREAMRRDDLMKPDVLSEIVLLASAIALFLPLLLMLIVGLTHIQ
jgi:hypothetical protein